MSKIINRKDFLELIFGKFLKEQDGYIETREFGNGSPMKRVFYDNIDDIKDYVPDSNLYFGVCPRQIKGNGKKESVQYVTALWVDVDYGEVGHKKRSEYSHYQEAFNIAKSMNPEPSLIINSGHGLHVYWLLERYVEVNHKHIEQVLKGLAGKIGGDTAYDISRILRLPDSKNLKISDDPKEVEVVFCDPDNKYILRDFEFLVDVGAGSMDLAEPIKGNGELRYRVNPEVRGLILNGKQKNDKYESRSEADYRVICHLVEVGYSDEVIWEIFSDYPIGEKFREQGSAYLRHSINSARSSMKRESSVDDVMELLDEKYARFNSMKVAGRIVENNYLIYTSNSFFVYKNGCYRQVSDEEIKRWVIGIIKNALSKKQLEEIFSFLIAKQAKSASEVNTTGTINFKNGLFDSKTFQLLPHMPEVYSTIQLNAKYNPNAKCDLWLKTLDEIFPFEPNKIQILQEFFGLCLTKETKYEKALICIGDGANGKSLILNVFQALVGRDNYSAVPLEQFSNRFYVAEFYGKLVNISIETNSKFEIYDSIFKAVVSGDTLEADYKFKKPFKFNPFCKLIVAINKLPRVSDKTLAYFRRLILLRFDRVFEESEQNKNLKSELLEELDGIFIWCLEGFRRLTDRGYFLIDDNMKQEIEEYKRENNNVLLFVEEKCDFQSWSFCPTANLYSAYSQWCKVNGHGALSKASLVKELKSQFRNLTPEKKKGERGLMGIALKAGDFIPV